MAFPTRARLTIDLGALAANYRTLRRTAGDAEVAAVVKSDGYGLGAALVAGRLRREGAQSFFVARLDEGESLRTNLGREADIYVLDGLTAGAGPRLAAAGLTPVLNTVPQVEAAAAFAAGAGAPLACALHIDTGMNRQGLTLSETRALAAAPARLAPLDIRLVMSHLGSAHDPADRRNREQLERFMAVRPLFPQARASFANSGGTFLGPEYRFDMVRSGISLYGGGPEERPDTAIAAVARLEAPVLDLRRIAAGEHLGYGSGLVMHQPSRVAIVAAGYTDGLIRAARGGGYAWLAGARRRLLAVTMDLTILELDEAPVEIGEMAELLGPNALLDDLARAAGTVAHEVLVRLSPRAERIILD